MNRIAAFLLRNARSLLALALLLPLSGCSTTLGPGEQQALAGKTYVIIGASSGFGRGVAERLGAQHANVVLAARRTDLLQEVAGRIQSTGGTALVVTTDISRPEEVRRLAESATSRFGHVDVWINDTGVGVISRFWDAPADDYSRLIDVNFKGVVYGSQAAIRLFRTQGYGTLVNLGSIDSEVPLAYQATYAATKAAVLSLGRSINEELRLDRKRNIHVATVMPWAVDTPWWRHAANYSGGTPRMGLLDDPQKIVDAILWVSVHPQEELPVGWRAKTSYYSHRFFPDLTERMSADVAHKYQIETAPPAPPTKGSLFEPMAEGRGIDDGVRARIRRENEARKRGETPPPSDPSPTSPK